MSGYPKVQGPKKYPIDLKETLKVMILKKKKISPRNMSGRPRFFTLGIFTEFLTTVHTSTSTLEWSPIQVLTVAKLLNVSNLAEPETGVFNLVEQ